MEDVPQKLRFRNDFLQLYLEYVEETESPRMFHIWSALAGLGACLGRRVSFPFGRKGLFGNLYVLLVGPPASRKSTALELMRDLIMESTNVKIAPDDTGGKYQGLISALTDDDTDEIEKALANFDATAGATPDNLGILGAVPLAADQRDAHVMFVAASEFTTFIGHNAQDMITFLGKIYDGEPYHYQLKNTKQLLTDALAIMLGGTTTTNIATHIPKEAIGQGFMSRIILVHGAQKYKHISRPRPMPEELEKEVKSMLTWANTVEGVMEETPRAAKMLDDLYGVETDLNDPRFVHYCDRRYTHLIKVAICLAIGRRSLRIEQQDIEEANLILSTTEKFMPDALGEYGLSPLAVSKQQLLEFLQRARVPIPEGLLWANLQRDMRFIDFKNTLLELVNAKKIHQVNGKEGVAYLYNDKKAAYLSEAAGMLEEFEDVISIDPDADDTDDEDDPSDKIIILPQKKEG